MSALSDENPEYTLSYSVPATGKDKSHRIRRDELRRTVQTWAAMIADRSIVDVTVTNRFDVDVTVDWFG